MKLRAEQTLTGIGLTFAASVLLPMLKKVGQGAWRETSPGLLAASQELQQRLGYVGSLAKEELEDFMAEVEFERLKKKIDHDLGSDNRTDE